ncbi:hypothetical protein [Neisseria lactamica]|uniref:hypothetical protein n=1 Tax=Neisseria lactamica TaxID=486 RepID=UPI0027E111FC|nr:hypothetical protein [Neisseria lactamica]
MFRTESEAGASVPQSDFSGPDAGVSTGKKKILILMMASKNSSVRPPKEMVKKSNASFDGTQYIRN